MTHFMQTIIVGSAFGGVLGALIILGIKEVPFQMKLELVWHQWLMALQKQIIQLKKVL